MMYGTLLRNFESTKDDYALVRTRYEDIVGAHSAAVAKLEQSQVRCVTVRLPMNGRAHSHSSL